MEKRISHDHEKDDRVQLKTKF